MHIKVKKLHFLTNTLLHRFRRRNTIKEIRYFLNGSKDRPGKTIRSVKRDIYLVVLVGGLIILLIYITRKQGGYTIVSVILNTLIFAYGFQLLGDGKNILRICNVIALLFSLTTLICLNGIHRKTWAAVLSTLCVLFLIMMLFDFSIHRYGDFRLF